MRINFSVRNLILLTIVILVSLVFIFAPELDPIQAMRRVGNATLHKLEELHIIRLDTPHTAETDPFAPPGEEKTFLDKYRRTKYDLFVPVVDFLGKSDEASIQRGIEIAREFAESVTNQPLNLNEQDLTMVAEKMLRGEELDDVDHDIIRTQFQQARPFLQTLRKAALQHDFDPDDLDYLEETGQIDKKSMDLVARGVGLLCLEALQEKEQGASFMAWRNVAAAAQIAMPRSVARLDMQKTLADSFSQSVDTWSDVAAHENDLHALSNSVLEMNDLAQEYAVRTEQVQDPVSRDLLSRLRLVKRQMEKRGIKTEGQVGRVTPDYLLEEYVKAKEKYLARIKEEEDREKWEAKRRQFEAELEELNQEVKTAMERRKAELQRIKELEEKKPKDFHPQEIRESAARAKLDLLRLESARKLYTKQKGQTGKVAPDMLAPTYLSHSPLDPFSQKEYDMTDDGLFYSPGPDREDGGGSVLYDPTNGVLSAGDIFLPSFHQKPQQKVSAQGDNHAETP